MRIYPERPILGVGAVILDRGLVVLVERAHEPLKGEWSLPGGVLDVGETLEAAVAREVLEETGLIVEVGPPVEIVERIIPDASGRIQYHFVIADYLCRVTGGTIACASDAAAAEWVPVADLDRFGVSATAVAVILKAVSMASAPGSG